MIVLHTQKGYPEQRNFLNNKSTTYIKNIDPFKIICHLAYVSLQKTPLWALNLYWNPFHSKRRIVHLFNGICLSKQKWICTFESSVPRVGYISHRFTRYLINRLAKENCIKLIAISNSSLQIQKEYLKTNYPKYYSIIRKKIIVLHPPQPVIFEKEKPIKSIIQFTIVGADFFRKGGAEILRSLNVLQNQGYSNWHLNIISSLKYGDYASCSSVSDYTQAIKMIKACQNITHYKSLNNADVLKVLETSHVALLPTYADTYGYSVLEAQACSCPVISTDVRALSEINNNECGWIIPVPKDALGNAIISTPKQRAEFSSYLENKLTSIIHDILENPGTIRIKAIKAIDRVRKYHNPAKHGEVLNKIYEIDCCM